MTFNCSGGFARRSFVSAFGNNTRVVGFIKKLTFWARSVVRLEISFPVIFDKYKIMIMHFKSFECCLQSSSSAALPSSRSTLPTCVHGYSTARGAFREIVYHGYQARNYYVYQSMTWQELSELQCAISKQK